jgi:molybdenum cofactor cytidylyltransferase
MNYSIQQIGILIVAAGQSKRLGHPKQLLHFEGKSLINRLIDTVKSSGPYPITLVLGSAADEITTQITASPVDIVFNDQWNEGMASSIRVGVKRIMNLSPNIDGIMIFVCDQPFISVVHIQSLIKLQQDTGLPMASCYYANILGTPAIFHQNIFSELLALEGDVGAKKIIKDRVSEVAKLHVEEGIVDIDTMDDYIKLTKQVSVK